MRLFRDGREAALDLRHEGESQVQTVVKSGRHSVKNEANLSKPLQKSIKRNTSSEVFASLMPGMNGVALPA